MDRLTQSSPFFDAADGAGYGDSIGMRIAAGDVLASRYRADVLLGRGGMGEVWRCFDLEEERDVAVKTVLAEHLSNPHASRLFQAEVIAVARLSHPGIVEVYDLLPAADGSSLLVMEYRPGRPLDEALVSLPSWSLVRALLVQLLEALAHAHARSVLHLDIKPANVLVERRGEGIHATLVDFGIARVKQPGRGAEKWFDAAVVVGTLEYMAPEQCRGELEKLGPWTDLYALGMMAYELTTGLLPHPGDDPAEALRRRLSRPAPALVPRLNSVPPGFDHLCARLLALEPRDRPACAADVLAELERIDPRDAHRSDLRGLSSRPAGESGPPPDSASAPTLAAPPTDAPTLFARERMEEVFAQLDREEEATPSTGAHSVLPPSAQRAEEAEHAFNADASPPTPGAYGLFGLRELPVLGRVEERRALWTAIGATALEGRAGGVLLMGPAGTGKSRLARDAVERSLELGLAHVLHTQWSSGGSADEGIVGLLENALESRGHRGADFEARLSFWLERFGGRAEAFARELRVLLRPEQDAAPDAGLPLRAGIETFARVGRERPILLWLDDVQWSRGEATALLQALAAQNPVPPVCVLATVREEEMRDPREHEAFVRALEELCRAAGTRPVQVPMRPLGRAAARAMVRGLLDLEPELRELVASRSEGNPLFATQLVRQLVVERAIVKRGRRYGLAPRVDLAAILPADIGAVWARRVVLSGASESDLCALAVVRERVSIEVADALARIVQNGLSLSIARALAAGLLLREGERYAWAHGLLREYLLRSVHGARAARLHGWAADALFELVGREDVQEERALHLCHAGRHREACEAMLEAALWCWRRAEREARQRRVEVSRAWAAAQGFVDLEARALAELASIHADAGLPEEAARWMDEAKSRLRASGDARASAWVSFRHAQTLRLAGLPEEGAAQSREAIGAAQRAGEADIEATSLVQLGLDAYRRGDAGEARELFRQAGGVARRAGNRATEALVLMQQSLLEPPARQEHLLRRAIQTASSAGALRIELMMRQLWVDALWRVGERARARAEARVVSREAARRSLRQTVSIVELQAACWAVEEEAWELAREHRRSAGRWGAATGAVPERAFAAALDLVLALVDCDREAAEAAARCLQCETKGYNEKTFADLLRKAATMAPADLAQRLRAL